MTSSKSMTPTRSSKNSPFAPITARGPLVGKPSDSDEHLPYGAGIFELDDWSRLIVIGLGHPSALASVLEFLSRFVVQVAQEFHILI
jgi:hypothetical protein